MRASEFINEATKGKVPKRYDASQPGAHSFSDGGVDRIYHLNQIMKAVAMSDGSSTKPLDMDDESFAGKNNMVYPYSDIEDRMMKQAFNTVSPTTSKNLISNRGSNELDSVNRASPVAKRPTDHRRKK